MSQSGQNDEFNKRKITGTYWAFLEQQLSDTSTCFRPDQKSSKIGLVHSKSKLEKQNPEATHASETYG